MATFKKAMVMLVTAVSLILLVAIGVGYQLVRRSFPRTTGSVAGVGARARIEISRDQWGVPHILAQSDYDVYFAQGYVHAQDRLWQMDMNRRTGAGRLAEVLGEAALPTDRLMRTLGIYTLGEKDLQVLPPEVLTMLQGYADGVNAFLEAHRDRLPLEFIILGYAPEPWSPLDSLAWTRVMAYGQGGNWERELLRARLVAAFGESKLRELAPLYPSEGPCIVPGEATAFFSFDPAYLDGVARPETGGLLGFDGAGSNSWVVDGSQTATGRPLLANDPHLAIQMPSIWYQVHLTAPDLDVVGVSFPGAPGVIIGHNDRIAWGLTNAIVDVQDLYIERVNPANPREYEYLGSWEAMSIRVEELQVRGRAEPERLEVRATRHGPIITPVAKGAVEELSLRWTALDELQMLRAVYDLNRASNWSEFREALRSWQAPCQNIIYADVDGNIGYQLPGNIPIRSKGRGLVPVPGWSGEYDWTGYIPYDDLPSVLNPPNHIIVTANNKIAAEGDVPFLSDEYADPYRAQRILELLSASDDVDVEYMIEMQSDVHSEPAAAVVPYILAANPEGWLQERAMGVLRSWDWRLDADSSGAGLAQVFLQRLLANTFGDELRAAGITDWNGSTAALLAIMPDAINEWFDDVSTGVVESRDDIVRRSFQETTDFWGNRFGDWIGAVPDQWGWGKAHFAVFQHPLGSVKPLHLLFNRGPVALPGSADTINVAGHNATNMQVRLIPSYRQVIDVGGWENSVWHHSTGQSGQPLHPHYDDLMEGWRSVTPYPMLFEPRTVNDATSGVLLLEP